MKINDVLIDDNLNIATNFNNYFSQIGPNLANAIPRTEKSFKCFLKNENSNSLSFVQTNANEIIKIVQGLKKKKSSGYDDISNDLLKEIINEIIVPLEHVLNLSIINGEVPEKMKIAKVVPIYKKGDQLDIANYRPISLLSSISKILDKNYL